MLQWPWRRFTSGSSDFVMVVNRLKTRRDRDLLQHKKPRRMLKEYVKSFDQTGDWLLGNFLRIRSKHFNNRFEPEASECEICSTCFDGRTKATAFVSFIGVARSCRFRFQFFGNVITGDETWVYGYDTETRVQSSQWKSPSSPRAKKARQSRSNIKVMMIVFFLTLWNYVSWGCTQKH